MAESSLFPGFTTLRIQTPGAEIRCVVGGSGPPLLLLHGYPQTHVIWHKIAPALAHRFTVVCADLRGYGDSSKPASDPQHTVYSKRAMAQDMVELMRDLGHSRFLLGGHDRGGRVAHRLCLDHPDAVVRVTGTLLVPWCEKGGVHRIIKPVEDWRTVADDVRGKSLPCGHYLAEEQPQSTLFELETFFSDYG